MKNQQLLRGIIIALIGVFFIYWAQTHSPNAGLGNIVSNELSGSYTLSTGWYYSSLIIGILIAAAGILHSYKAVKK